MNGCCFFWGSSPLPPRLLLSPSPPPPPPRVAYTLYMPERPVYTSDGGLILDIIQKTFGWSMEVSILGYYTRFFF